MGEVADKIVELLELAETLEGGNHVLDKTPAPPKRSLILTPQEVRESPKVISMPEAPPSFIGVEDAGEKVHHTVSEISAFLAQYAPQTIDVVPKGGTEPIRLSRKIISPPQESFGFVKLSYVPQFDSEGPTYQFMTTDAELDIQAALSEIKTIAESTFSKEERKLTPRAAGENHKKVLADIDGFEGGDPKAFQEFRTDPSTWDAVGKT
jgi:hypothetical protein